MFSPSIASRRHAAVVVSLAALTVAACAKKDVPAADTTAAMSAPAPAATDSAAPAASAAPATLTDAQIAHVAVTANSIDSTAGALAKSKGTAKAVKDFGSTMMEDHGSVNKQAVALVTKLNVTPEDNDVSKSLKSGADANMAHLNGLSGAAFDSAYISHEVDYHQAVLDALDKTLIPNAQNAELKALLVKVRPAFVAHLDRAKSVQSGLGKK